MRCFGIEGGDFFGLVENLHRTVQHHVHLDSPVSIRTKGRGLGNLQDRPFESNRVVLGHGTLLLEAQGLFDLKSTDLSPSGLCLSRLGEFMVITGSNAPGPLACSRVLALASRSSLTNRS